MRVERPMKSKQVVCFISSPPREQLRHAHAAALTPALTGGCHGVVSPRNKPIYYAVSSWPFPPQFEQRGFLFFTKSMAVARVFLHMPMVWQQPFHLKQERKVLGASASPRNINAVIFFYFIQ